MTLIRKFRQERLVRDISQHGCHDDVSAGKTGATLPIDDEGFLREGQTSLLPSAAERTGWFVGWVERPSRAGGAAIIAHNLDLSLPNAITARTNVAYAILSANGVFVGEGP